MRRSPTRVPAGGGLWPVVLLVAAACDRPAESPETPEAPEPAGALTHDFGTVAHGEVARHDFDVPLPGGGAGLVPLAFRTGCSCVRPAFLIRKPDGSERVVDRLPRPMKTLQDGDTLVLRLTLDTTLKEPVDRPRLTQSGAVIVQRQDGSRLEVPVAFDYAIDAPVAVHPVAHFDFGALPRSRVFRQTVELRPDPGVGDVAFGEPRPSDPRIEATLRPEGESASLEVAFTPGAEAPTGPVRAKVSVPTGLDGYRLELPVSGQIVSDIQVLPFPHLSFGRFDLDQPREQFVNVTDHDLSRPAGFEVASIEDVDGSSLAEHFEARLVPIEGDPRSTRLRLHYLGTLGGAGFRGVVTLAKPGGAGPETEITFVGFREPQ